MTTPVRKMLKNRKRWIVYPTLQWGFLGYTFVVALLVSAIHFCAIEYFFRSFNQMAHEAGVPPTHVFFRFINEQRSDLTAILIIASILVLVILLMLGLILSHRVAGPIYRMQRFIENDCQGELKFRKNDYLKEVADSINRAKESKAKAE